MRRRGQNKTKAKSVFDWILWLRDKKTIPEFSAAATGNKDVAVVGLGKLNAADINNQTMGQDGGGPAKLDWEIEIYFRKEKSWKQKRFYLRKFPFH